MPTQLKSQFSRPPFHVKSQFPRPPFGEGRLVLKPLGSNKQPFLRVWFQILGHTPLPFQMLVPRDLGNPPAWLPPQIYFVLSILCLFVCLFVFTWPLMRPVVTSIDILLIDRVEKNNMKWNTLTPLLRLPFRRSSPADTPITMTSVKDPATAISVVGISAATAVSVITRCKWYYESLISGEDYANCQFFYFFLFFFYFNIFIQGSPLSNMLIFRGALEHCKKHFVIIVPLICL